MEEPKVVVGYWKDASEIAKDLKRELIKVAGTRKWAPACETVDMSAVAQAAKTAEALRYSKEQSAEDKAFQQAARKFEKQLIAYAARVEALHGPEAASISGLDKHIEIVSRYSGSHDTGAVLLVGQKVLEAIGLANEKQHGGARIPEGLGSDYPIVAITRRALWHVNIDCSDTDLKAAENIRKALEKRLPSKRFRERKTQI